MDFSYPSDTEQFRKELRAWLAANLTDEVRAAGRHRGRDPEAFEKLREWAASLAESVWAEAGQELAALACDLLGPRCTKDRWTDRRLSSRSLIIAGGTTQINKSVTAVRVLGLPRP